MDNRIHPITKEAAYEVASNLTEADHREVFEGHGIDGIWTIILGAITQQNTDAIYTNDGKIAAMIGVEVVEFGCYLLQLVQIILELSLKM